ncbi:MAG: FG-GAP repeat domain-containing protein [Chthoniobacteraceae bacterium]
MKVCIIALLALPVLALAQQPTPAPVPKGQNIFRNGNFEKFTDEDNLWDGVDRDGLLSGDVIADDAGAKIKTPAPKGVFYGDRGARSYSIDAILDGGNTGRLALPVSVQVADLNRDGLLDLITVDSAGYFRVYFNSGTPTEPKFTHCELVPIFLGRFPWPGVTKTGDYWRRSYGDGLKLALAEFDKNGLQDLLLGNYYGDLLVVKNTGTLQVPEWKQPVAVDSIKLPTTKDGQLWANLMAPAAFDWNRDGKLDILVGEGSYSANAIHLLLNATGMGGGSGAGAGGFVGTAAFSTSAKSALPTYNEDFHEYLAFGDGREQLAPAVVDYNGDGQPDLLVGDRMGQINVYLSEGTWKKGVELKRQPQPINFGGTVSIGSGPAGMRCLAPTAADLNGDGKFDIIVGKPDGHIAVSYNIGTATEPKFGPLVDLKGEKVFPRGSIRAPGEWKVNFGYFQGNFLNYFSVVSPQEDPEAAQATGKNVLKFGYSPSQNRIIRRAPLVFSTTEQPTQTAPFAGFQADFTTPNYWGDTYWRGSYYTDSNNVTLRQESGWNVIRPNVKYTLSFRVKGRNVKKGHLYFLFGGWLVRDMVAAKQPAPPADVRAAEALMYDFDFNVGPTWTTVSRPVNFKFVTQPDLNNFDKWNKPGSKIQYNSLFDLRAALVGEDAVFYIDDIKLIEM